MSTRIPMWIVVVVAVPALPVSGARAQGGWETVWEIRQPASQTGTYGWMAGQNRYTGLAYDRWHDVLYVVNPAICSNGGAAFTCATVRILDANTGLPRTDIGRAADGSGGQLPVPRDTVVQGTVDWPGAYGGYAQGQFGLYKIDVDDEGRIFACNLVDPIWGICFPGPPPNCLPEYLSQGPFRLYRWDTPASTPKRVYATLDGTHTAVGSGVDDPPDTHVLSEMTYTSWGNALDVVGKRRVVLTPGGTLLLDSARIFVTGAETNEVDVLVADTSGSMPGNGIDGQRMEYRLGTRLLTPHTGIAAQGIAVTGATATSPIWTDAGCGPTTLFEQAQRDPIPQTVGVTPDHRLPEDTVTGTGPSGPIAFIDLPQTGKQLLACADAYPSNAGDPAGSNANTRARLVDVTVFGSERRLDDPGDTPPLGSHILTSIAGTCQYISDVDSKLEADPASGTVRIVLFVLMSNNGIACYRTRTAYPIVSTVPGEPIYVGGARYDHVTLLRRPGVAPRGDDTAPPTDGLASRGEASPACAIEDVHPNPCATRADVTYRLDRPGVATLTVFDAVGRAAAVLAAGPHDSGTHTAGFERGDLPAGVYVVRLAANNRTVERRFVVVR